MKADVLCFQKTSSQKSEPALKIPGYSCYHVGGEKGDGVTSYVKSHLVERKKLIKVDILFEKENEDRWRYEKKIERCIQLVLLKT